MHAFQVDETTPEQFVERVRQVLEERQLDDLVTISLSGSELEARFSKLGTTVLRYRLEGSGSGFEALLEHSRVARLHAPFRQRFEESFGEVIACVGACPAET